MIVAAVGGQTDLLEGLLAAKASVEEATLSGRTPLMAAAASNQIEVWIRTLNLCHKLLKKS